VERIWLPGEQSHLKREAARKAGIALAAPLVTELDQLADSLRVPRLVRLGEADPG
jgi:LDH2 family malate/lactate/ureidoglycolate dehydrogenase